MRRNLKRLYQRRNFRSNSTHLLRCRVGPLANNRHFITSYSGYSNTLQTEWKWRALSIQARPRTEIIAFFSSSSHSDDPDIFRGPGGLTGRQIFEAVQRSVHRDEAFQRNDNDSNSNGDSGFSRRNRSNNRTTFHRGENTSVAGPNEESMMLMSVRDIKDIAADNSIEITDCYDKEALVSRIVSFFRSHSPVADK